jgi:hypothetical protein
MTLRTGQLRQVNRDGTTTASERGYLGQGIQLRQGNWDRTIVPIERGHLGQDHSNKTAGTGHLGQDSQDSTVSKGWPDRQPGQVSLEKTEMTGLPGHDSDVRRAVANVAWAGQLEQEDR